MKAFLWSWMSTEQQVEASQYLERLRPADRPSKPPEELWWVSLGHGVWSPRLGLWPHDGAAGVKLGSERNGAGG